MISLNIQFNINFEEKKSEGPNNGIMNRNHKSSFALKIKLTLQFSFSSNRV